MRRFILWVLLSIAAEAALWDMPRGDLSLARSHITGAGTNIQPHPRLWASLAGMTNFNSLDLVDEGGLRIKSLPMPAEYPELQVSLKLGKFEAGIFGEQILDAGGKIWEQDSSGQGRAFELYRLSAEIGWWPISEAGVILGYNHCLGRLLLDEAYFGDTVYKGFGNSPGVSAGFVTSLSNKITLDAVAFWAACLSFYSTDDTDGKVGFLSLPVSVTGDLDIAASERFSFSVTTRYTLNRMAEVLHTTLPSDTIDSSDTDLILYSKNSLNFQARACYSVIPPLSLGLLGSYSTSPVDSLDATWPNPGSLSLAVTGSWRKDPWQFSLTVGGGHFQSLFSNDFSLDGRFYFLKAGVGLAI